MNEFNFRTTVNHRLQADEAATFLNRIEARRRQSARRLHRIVRQHTAIIALDAALIGAILASSIILLACMVG